MIKLKPFWFVFPALCTRSGALALILAGLELIALFTPIYPPSPPIPPQPPAQIDVIDDDKGVEGLNKSLEIF